MALSLCSARFQVNITRLCIKHFSERPKTMEGIISSTSKGIENDKAACKTLADDLWQNPELAYAEHHAHEVLTNFLEARGFQVTRKYKLDTAFRASYVQDEHGPHIAVLCEYDALPGIGHACGHNLIAEVGVATSLGIKHAMEQAGKPLGTLTVLGTPAEEGGGGKIDLIRAGAFTGVDVAMMAHPAPHGIARPVYSAINIVQVKYFGKAAHAAGFPWNGLNALDAAVLCYQSVSCMRQQMKPTWRVHGVIINGGAKPNIIPEETELEFYIRAMTNSDLALLKQMVINCFEGAALSTNCRVEYVFDTKPYAPVLSNNTLASMYEKHALVGGVPLATDPAIMTQQGGSTDMGNVSHVVPSIHPKFFIGTDAALHTREFAAAAGAESAQQYSLAVADALAKTAMEVFTNPSILETIRDDFATDIINPQ